MKNILFIVGLLSVHIVTNSQPYEDVWRVLPVRSQEEFEQDKYGGAGEQHPHSIARCFQHPEHIYLSQDVGGTWRSTDNGQTWKKNLDKGLFLPFGQSIAVDPVNPEIALIIIDDAYNYLAGNYQGVYRTEDGGENWELVLPAETKIVRMHRNNLDFDRTKIKGTSHVKTWYAAMVDNGLYRSDDGGKTWSSNPVSSLTGHQKIYMVRSHPTDSQTVFVASELGLFKSTEKGSGLAKVESLPADVSSVNIHPNHPDSIFATVPDDGLYLSTNGGISFDKIRAHDAQRMHMNLGFPEQLYLIGNNRNSMVSHNGGTDWQLLPEATTFPGLGRETGWRRWVDRNFSGVVPNPKNKNEMVCYSRSTLFKSTDGAKSIHESATGWTGNAWSWTDNSAAFHPWHPDTFAFFCNDIGTRITTTGGNWFHESTNSEAGSWYPEKIAWYGTYAGDFQPKSGSQTMVAAIGGYFKTQIMRSENLGQTWQLVTEGPENEDMHLFVRFHAQDPNFIYAGDKFSDDAGKSFQKFPFPEQYDEPYVIAMCDAYPDVIYALDKPCKVILRSCDRGQNWEVYSRPGWKFRYFDNLPTFAADPVNPFKLYTLDRNHDLASFDGEKWTSFNVMQNISGDAAYNYVRNVAVDPNNPDIIYAGMFASGGPQVMRTQDGGKTWEDISHNLSRIGGTLKVNPHTGELYRGSLFGTWIFPAPYNEVPDPVIPDFKTGLEIGHDSLELRVGETQVLQNEVILLCDYKPVIHWSTSDTAVAKVNTEGLITACGEGTCTISAQTANGWYTDECKLTVTSQATGIHETSKISFHVFPASDNRLMVHFPSPVKLVNISLYNTTGLKVMSKTFPKNVYFQNKELDISGLANGFYVLAIAASTGVASKKIVKN